MMASQLVYLHVSQDHIIRSKADSAMHILRKETRDIASRYSDYLPFVVEPMVFSGNRAPSPFLLQTPQASAHGGWWGKWGTVWKRGLCD